MPAIAYGGPTLPPDQPSPQSTKLAESLILVELIADLFPSSNLLPTDPVLRARARFFIDGVSTKLVPAYVSLMLKDGDPEQLLLALEHIQSLLPTEAQGDWALGEAFSAADISIVPFLARIKLCLENDQGGFPGGKGEGARILAMLREPKLARFNKYWAHLEARPSFVATWDAVSTAHCSHSSGY